MTSLDDYINDWKNIKGSASSFNNDSTNLKNENIMKNLIQFEKAERKEQLFGLVSGLLGLVFGIFFGFIIPYSMGFISFTPLMGVGFILTITAITLFYFLDKENNINLSIGQPTKKYLQETLYKLQSKKQRKSRNGLIFLVLFLMGMWCLQYELISSFSIVYSIGLVSIGLFAFLTWKWRYNKIEDKKIKPLVEEIQSMIKEL